MFKGEEDSDFKRLLQSCGLISLHSKFAKAGVDKDVLWDLDDDLLDEAKLTGIEKLKYKKAKEKLSEASSSKT